MLAVSAGPAFAAEGWQAGGGVTEPSTEYDTGTYMFAEANDQPVDKIYFNGFQINGWNPTVDGNVEGGSTASHLYRLGAYLGYWRDCNGDGFVGAKTVAEAYGSNYGHFNNGAYPADLYEIDTTVCPPNTPYNQGTFVDEFRWIGPNATYDEDELQEIEDNRCSADNVVTIPDDPTDAEINDDCFGTYKDLYDVTDKDAIVWVDLSRPESMAATTRPVFAKELFDSSSDTLDLVGFYGLHNDVQGLTGLPAADLWNDKPNFGDCGDAGRGEREFGGGPTMNAWGTDTGVSTCGYYPLWQAKRLVNDSESEHDQGAEPLVSVYDTENDNDESGSACDDTDVGGLSMADIDPSVREDNPLMEGSLGATIYRNVFYSTNVLHATNTTNPAFSGECDEDAYPPSVLASSSAAPGKYRVDTFLIYYPETRYRGLRDAGVDNVPMDALGIYGGPGSVMPWIDANSRWLSFHVYIRAFAHNTLTSQYWTTFFADVSPMAFESSGASPSTALPAGVQDVHTYGQLECGGDFSDTEANQKANAYGWICSQAVWQEEADEFNGNDAPDGVDDRLRVIAGQAFDLRDADCMDDTVAEGLETGDVYLEARDGSGGRTDVRITCQETGHVNDVVTVVNNT